MPDQTPAPVAPRPEPHPAHSFAIDVAKIATVVLSLGVNVSVQPSAGVEVVFAEDSASDSA